MSTHPEQAAKLLNFALNRSAGDDEAANAFTRARALLHANGIDNASKLATAIGDASRPGEECCFPFGKHAGDTVRDVWFADRTYCRWFRSDIDPDGSVNHADVIREVHEAIDALESEGRR